MERDSHLRRPGAVAAAVLLLVAATTLAQAPSTPAVVVRIERLLVTVTFDLVSADPAADFDVSLVVTNAAGQPVQIKPTSVTGVGRLKAGPRQIIWDAGQDSDFPPLADYKYAVSALAVIPTGVLTVRTDPPGATVTVDGVARGTTALAPVTVTNLTIGPHEVIVSRPGYLDYRVSPQEAQVRADQTTSVTAALTAVPVAAPPASTSTSQPRPEPAAKGSPVKWLVPVAGGGAAAALLALKGKKATGTTPQNPACAFSLSPTAFSSPSQAGGTTAVTVSVGPTPCSGATSWTATDGSFMTVSPSSGSGTGNVTVTLQANNTVAARTGSVTIAGIAFAVTNQPGLPSVTGTVSGNTVTFAAFTGITVVAGQKLTITASGTICTNSPGCSVNASPNGSGTGNAGSAGRLPGAPSHSLICGIAGQAVGDVFFVGSSFTTTAAVGGQLFCGLNEPNGIQSSYDDNTGTWTVTVVIGG